MTNEKCSEKTENEKGRALLTSLALNFIASVELADFLNIFDRHLAVSHCACDFKLGARVLFALF